MAPEKENGDPVALIGLIARGVSDGIRALLRAGGGVVASVLQPRAAPRGTRADTSADPALRAIAGGAALRARRRTEAGRTEPLALEPERVATFPMDDGAGPLGDPVDEDRIELLPRDPRTVFAYWYLRETSSALRESGPGQRSAPRPHVLLVEATDHDSAGTESWFVPLGPLAETCYVDLLKPRRSVRIVLGMHGEDGAFIPLASSTPLSAPQHTAAASEPPRWHGLAPSRGESVAPPTTPPRETSEILCTRALAGERATSGSAAWGQHGLQSERDDSVARRR